MKRLQLKQLKGGFTLVEILVVIAIISVLVAFLMVNFNEARQSARDEVRKSDLKEIQLALEVYKAQNKTYPALLRNLVPEYIAKMPEDPSGAAYTYITDGYVYKVIAEDTVESKFIAEYTDEFARCPWNCTGVSGADPVCESASVTNSVQSSYAVYSNGAECI